jgi:hypothetical protein
VWFHARGIANVLSLSRVAKLYPVSFTNEDGFIIYKPDGRKHVFKESNRGLFYLDVMGKHKKDMGDAVTMIMTVEDQKAAYSARDFEHAELAQKLQHLLGHPSDKQLIKIIEGNQLANCPIGKDDILAADDIFGKSIGALKGKTVRKRPHAVKGTVTNLPAGILEKYRSVTLAFNIMFVNKVAFLVTISRHLQFGTADRLPSQKDVDVVHALKEVVSLYKARGFRVDVFLADGEFEPLRQHAHELGGVLNTTSNDEHVGDVKRYI